MQARVKALAAEAEAAREEGQHAGREEGEKEAAEWRSRAEKAEEKLQAAQSELTTLRHRMEAAGATAPTPEELEVAHRRAARLEAELEEARASAGQREGAAGEVDKLRDQLRQANAEAAEARQRVASLEAAQEDASASLPAAGRPDGGGAEEEVRAGHPPLPSASLIHSSALAHDVCSPRLQWARSWSASARLGSARSSSWKWRRRG